MLHILLIRHFSFWRKEVKLIQLTSDFKQNKGFLKKTRIMYKDIDVLKILLKIFLIDKTR